MRNILRYYLEGQSPNGFRVADLILGADPGRGNFASETWPYGATNELALSLLRRRREHTNFFYSSSNIFSHHWSTLSIRNKGVSSSRAIVPSKANTIVDVTASPNSPNPSNSSRHNMDVEEVMDSLREEKATIPGLRANSSEEWEKIWKEWKGSGKLIYSQDLGLTSPTPTEGTGREEEAPDDAATPTLPNEEQN
ncbi:hypothetical protein PVK06_047558 [Gossypium arboreum]|uniref:Uncharacterized protein n=1 Tax=Gossypium arboreum TaxID=29729 RepID=A0ABR0MDQ0_GOSAR|nr:hypothetical protein PVK06_047558 [Gossypium arboreum]